MNAVGIVDKLLETEDDPVSSVEALRLHDLVPSHQREALKKFLASRRRESQYVGDYLTLNDALGDGKGQTIQTFLASRIKGKARDYFYRYKDALEAACLHRVALGIAFEGQSATGRTAYYSVDKDEWDRLWSSIK